MRNHLLLRIARRIGAVFVRAPKRRAPMALDDEWVDPAIATCGICLWDRKDGGMTNAVQLLVRPHDVRGDESGGHPGESFVMVTITREELQAMLDGLNADWEEVSAVANASMSRPQRPTREAAD